MYSLKNIPYFKEIVLTGLVNNIFNVEYISNGYFYTYEDTWTDPNIATTIEGAGYYPQATINFLLGVTLRFQELGSKKINYKPELYLLFFQREIGASDKEFGQLGADRL